jgi:hypothetical protein
VAGYEANIQNSSAFLYTNDEQVEFDIKHTTVLILAFKEKKCLVINLAKYIQNLLEENYKIRIK